MIELSRDSRFHEFMVLCFFYSHAALNCDDDFFSPLIWHILLELLTYIYKKKKTRGIFFHWEEYFFFFHHLELEQYIFQFHLFCTSLIIISILTFLVYRDHGEYRKVYSFWYGEIEI